MRSKLQGILFLLFLLVPFLTAIAQRADERQIGKDVSYLASDALEGRKPGTVQCNLAAEYIRKAFRQAGLKPLCEDGFQTYDVTTDIRADSGNRLNIDGTSYQQGVDFLPFSFSASAGLKAGVVFAGYGFDISADTLQWHDYEGLDVKGKWVLLLRGHPEPDNENSLFTTYAKERSKVMVARDKGAAGVLFVNGAVWDKNDELVNLYYDKSKAGSGIPVLHIKRSLADKILLPAGMTLAALEKKLNAEHKLGSYPLSAEIEAQIKLEFTTVKTQNVVFSLTGNPAETARCIVVGAHYDHLGWGGSGSGSRMPDTVAVHNGADDNASGVAAVMELARMLSKSKAALRHQIIFVAFSAEEMGLLGSTYFVSHPPVADRSIDLMLNFDMVGRMKKDNGSISIGGTGTFKGATEMLDGLMAGRSFKASYAMEGYGPSDHAPFYGDSISVLYFNTGAHQDYHTPQDDAGLINNAGIAGITELARDIITEVDRSAQPLVFLEAGPKTKAAHGGALKVRLGIMPDFANTEVKGLAVGAVTKGGPAYHGGMLKGDIITALNGKPVQNIYDYMDRLKTFSPGQTISVDILRGEQNMVMLIQL